MARARKRVCKLLLPKFLRLCFLKSQKSSRFCARRRAVWRAGTTNEGSLQNHDIDEQALDTAEQAQFAAPSLDRSRLIIEELKMGLEKNRHYKAEMGSKVSVRFEYKSEDGESLGKENCELVLGRCKAMRDWHEGICGMSVGDKRRLHIPSSLQSGRIAVCEVQLSRVHY